MIKDYFNEQILHNLGFSPTNQQREVVNLLTDFLLNPVQDGVFILRGYAGTGKTSLMAALVKTIAEIKQAAAASVPSAEKAKSDSDTSMSLVLLAPTGRAAKVFSLYSDHPAYTIHKRIYRQKSIDQDSLFEINFNMKANLLFICDEASMISNDQYTGGSMYGTGRLLEDLVHYVYNGKGCRLILMGDTAQLPPVGDGESPALQDDELRCLGLDVTSYTMTQVVRQTESSGILWNATHLRQLMDTEDIFSLPKIRFNGFADVKIVPGDELIDALEQCYEHDGEDDTIVVTRSNKRAVVYNNGIRNQILWREELLSSGDRIMIAKNNYFWCAPTPSDEKGNGEADPYQSLGGFIANGNMAVIKRVYNEREFYGFTFADVELTLPDYDDIILSCTVILDTLQAEAPSLTAEQQSILYNKVYEDYEEVNIAKPGERPQWKRATKKERLEAMKRDPYFNALQIKYAYAITCHKAQGGQWKNVFIDQGYMTDNMLGPDYFRWLYTAITRATSTVYFVNWKPEQTLQMDL